MVNAPLIASAILIPLSSFLLWLPWSLHIAHFYPTTQPKLAAPLRSHANLDSCAPLTASVEYGEVPQWCAEPIVHRESGWAYLACDDTRPWWDPVRHVWEAAPTGKRGGSLWAWHMAEADAKPFQLRLATNFGGESLHPLSISIVSAKANSSTASGGKGAAPRDNILVVSNHPYPHHKGVVDVLYHRLNSDEAILYRRISASGLDHRSPYRVVALDDEQWSEPVQPVQEREATSSGRPSLQLPSFLFTSVSPPCEELESNDDGTRFDSRCSREIRLRTQPPTITQYLWDVIWADRFQPRTPASIFIHIASGYSARSLFELDRATNFHPPLVKAWDGGGALGGSNSSFLHLLVTATSLKGSVLEQWDQHWVRGRSYGVETVFNPKTNSKSLVRWPSFITFWNYQMRNWVVFSLDVDRYGRLWTAGAADQGKAQRLIDSLRAWRSDEESSGDDIEAGALVHQMTYIHRLGPSVGHPWEVERLRNARKRGLWLSKEYYSSLVYRRSVQASPAAATTNSPGYLPRAPTGIAVDEERKRVILTSSWDRDVAVCEFKEGFVEM